MLHSVGKARGATLATRTNPDGLDGKTTIQEYDRDDVNILAFEIHFLTGTNMLILGPIHLSGIPR